MRRESFNGGKISCCREWGIRKMEGFLSERCEIEKKEFSEGGE